MFLFWFAVTVLPVWIIVGGIVGHIVLLAAGMSGAAGSNSKGKGMYLGLFLAGPAILLLKLIRYDKWRSKS